MRKREIRRDGRKRVNRTINVDEKMWERRRKKVGNMSAWVDEQLKKAQ